MELRDYQSDTVAAVYKGFGASDGRHSALVVIATGGGKTVVMAAIAQRWLASGRGRVMMIAHREELLMQARGTFETICGTPTGIEAADLRASPSDKIIVASVQTLQRGRMPAGDPPTLLMIDEAHHAPATTYQNVISKVEPSLLVGVTATPWRADKKALSSIFDDVAAEHGMLDLIRRGWLVDVIVEKLPVAINIQGTKMSAGDFSGKDLGRKIDPYIERVAANYAERYTGKKTVAFCPLVETSEQLAAAVQAHGIPAEHIDGKSTNRAAVLRRLKTGETRFVSNAMLLTEGFDEPSVDCILNLRATRSLTMYAQIMGRGSRLSPGKEQLLVLDPQWRADHNLIGPQHIIAEDERHAGLIARHLAKGLTLSAAADAAHDERQKQLTARVGQSSEDSIERIAWLLGEPELVEWEPTMRWHSLPPTPAQLQALGRWGVPCAQIRSRGLASALMDRLISRQKTQMASFKQAKFAARLGHPNPGALSRPAASHYIEQRVGD